MENQMDYKTDRSQALFKQAQQHLAGGVGSGTRAPSSGWQPSPIFVQQGSGSHLWDVDGNEYIDYLVGGGPLILGHRPRPVIDAVCDMIQERGSMFALAHDLEGQAAAKVCALLPGMEKLRFDNSGTGAVLRALRLARAFTGKTKVIRFEGHYHGWSDQIHWSNRFALADAGPNEAPIPVPNSGGIPGELASTVIILPWNDVDLLEKTIRAHKDEIAAVITEPILGNTGGIMPRPGYLQVMRRLTAENDIVLIFDEVLSGFRVGLHCAQGLYGIIPDLTTLAKAVAAGFPGAAVGGRADIMDQVADGRVMFGGTYNANPVVSAAVCATTDELVRPGVYETMNSLGEELANGLVDLARKAGFAACWSGVGPMFQLWFCEPDELPVDYRAAIPILARSPFGKFWHGLMRRGVLVQPRQDNLFLLCSVHSKEDIAQTLTAAEASLKDMRP
jgi:glutamate-1-semialdehyde 2,1-aminomutase